MNPLIIGLGIGLLVLVGVALLKRPVKYSEREKTARLVWQEQRRLDPTLPSYDALLSIHLASLIKILEGAGVKPPAVMDREIAALVKSVKEASR